MELIVHALVHAALLDNAPLLYYAATKHSRDYSAVNKQKRKKAIWEDDFAG